MTHLTKYRLQIIGIATTIVVAVLTAVLTLAPISSEGVPGSDKFYHVLAFSVLAFPLPFARPRFAVAVALGVIAYGGSIELVQPYFDREAQWVDFMADIVGAIIGASMGAVGGKWFRRSFLELRSEKKDSLN